MEASRLWQLVERNVEWIERRAFEAANAETERTRALDQKASQVLAVSALATSIAASALASAAGAAVLISAAASIWALFPRAFLSLTSEEMGHWATGDFLTQEPRDVQGRILNGWLEVILRARRNNSVKARLVRVALVALWVALVLTTVTAGTIVVNGG